MQNQAAWQKAARDTNYSVGPGPDHSKPAHDEVVIKVHVVAINPSEWKMQENPYKEFDYPWIFGSDAAGEVVLVGSKVTQVKLGDRVIGHFLGLSYGTAKHGSFQQYATTREMVVAKLPDKISYEQGAVMPLALSTSIVGLFDMLQLSPPSVETRASQGTVVLWGGASSIASMGIQLARAAGYEVITTASPKNHEYARALGASEVFDYRQPDVVKQINDSLAGRKLAGVFDCIGEEETTRKCAEIWSTHGGGLVPTVLWPPQNLPKDVKAELVIATKTGLSDDYPNVDIWTKFVSAALSKGVLVPKPEPFVIEGGIAKIQEAVDLHKKGVSARKIVVPIT